MTLIGGDSTNSNNLPVGLDAYAGYINGRYADFTAIAERFPSAHLLDITVNWSNVGTVLDIERLDATPSQAPVWARERLAAGVWCPVLYCSLDLMPTVISNMANAGIPRSSYRIWSAHYTGAAHICPGADGTQWVDHGGWDESLFSNEFFGNVPVPPPPPFIPIVNPTPEGGNMSSFVAQIPIGSNGEGWGVYDGGINSDPGSASLSPAVPFSSVYGVTPWCDDPAHDPNTPTPVVGMQDRGGWLFVKVTGAAPGPSTAIGYVSFSS